MDPAAYPPLVDLTGHYSNPRAPLRRLAELDIRADGLGAGVGAGSGASLRPRLQRRLTPEEVAKIAADYETGATAKELGDRFGVHRQTVIGHLERAGVPIRRGRSLEADEVDEAVRLYEDAWSAARLGKRYGVSDHTIRAALSKRGVELRRRSASEPRHDGRRG